MKPIITKLDEMGFVNVRLIRTARMSKLLEDKLSVSNPKSYIYSKNYKCPCCDMSFENWALKQSSLKMEETEIDLRPILVPFDPLYYDVIICPYCGYGAMTNYFYNLYEDKIELIKKNVTPNYIYIDYPMVYTVDIAVERYLVALLNTLVKGAKNSERAHICLKLAWLNRDKRDLGQETLFQQYALSGFKAALENEDFPICGMDEHTLLYIIAELSRRLGNLDEAGRYISEVIISKDLSQRLYDKAIMVKDLIRIDKAKEEAFADFRRVVQRVNSQLVK